jgi:hypothetical protein
MGTAISNRLFRHSIVLLSTTFFVLTSIAGSLVAAPVATAAPLVQISGDRDYPVGGNGGLQSGIWATDGPRSYGTPCWWFRFNAYPVTNFDKQQIANGGVTGPTKVEVPESDRGFGSRGCKDWHLVSA